MRVVVTEALAPLEEQQLDQEREANDLCLELLTSSIVPSTVPPVASRSSTISTRWPGRIASLWISSVLVPYSSAYSTLDRLRRQLAQLAHRARSRH